ncbi:MAG: tetratricopeptide TPR_2 repeat protein [uncultured bacterium]|nr:MAG: tetratricopeptide TPR_2 repeat protein [uncultured bacterium]
MDENLTQKSIESALKCNWKEAIKLNLLILGKDSEDIDALNRLARAYFENGEVNKAKKTSKSVFKISPENNIAKKSLTKYSQRQPTSKKQIASDISSFIEESGKTKLTTLINLGSEKVYSILSSGDEVLLTPHAHKVSVTTFNGNYIGKLADDLSARLRILIKNGNKYKVFVKSTDKNCVKIFIKGDVVSFPRETLEPFSEFGS